MAKKNTKYQWSEKQEDGEDAWVSRSQKKRDSTSLQRMGEELAQLGEGALRSLNLPDVLLSAVMEWKRISNHEGRRRQMQYIGRIMREDVDAEKVRVALAAIAEGHAVDAQRVKTAEQLRDALLQAEESALPGLCARLGDKAEEACALALQAKKERAEQRPPHAYRALFRLIMKAGKE